MVVASQAMIPMRYVYAIGIARQTPSGNKLEETAEALRGVG
jgi:hypothetical protein